MTSLEAQAARRVALKYSSGRVPEGDRVAAAFADYAAELDSLGSTLRRHLAETLGDLAYQEATQPDKEDQEDK